MIDIALPRLAVYPGRAERMDRPWTAINGVYVLAFAVVGLLFTGQCPKGLYDFGAVRAPSEPPAIRVVGKKIDACNAERLTRHISLLQRSENESHGLSAPSTDGERSPTIIVRCSRVLARLHPSTCVSHD